MKKRKIYAHKIVVKTEMDSLSNVVLKLRKIYSLDNLLRKLKKPEFYVKPVENKQGELESIQLRDKKTGRGGKGFRKLNFTKCVRYLTILISKMELCLNPSPRTVIWHSVILKKS